MKAILQSLFFTSVILIFFQCKNSTKTIAKEENPAATGFNISESDLEAIEIADKVMKAIGGRKAYDETRYLSWNFFGARSLVWDKKEGNVRIDYHKDSLIILVNIHTQEGKVLRNNQELTNPDTLQNFLKMGKNVWINDSYWLVMPMKLKDTGVTLKYLGEDKEEESASVSEKLELTFKEVGKTPENKYDVWVDKNTNLVSKWAFYKTAQDTVAQFETVWADYQQYGKILLSGDRGKNKLTEIGTFNDIPSTVFQDFKTPNPKEWK